MSADTGYSSTCCPRYDICLMIVLGSRSSIYFYILYVALG